MVTMKRIKMNDIFCSKLKLRRLYAVVSQGKEIACNIEKLPSGSVVFEDISDTTVKGQVLKPFEKDCVPRERNDPLPGRIKYRAPDHSEVEVSFGEKDQRGDFTLR